jgi:hypothetical protein
VTPECSHRCHLGAYLHGLARHVLRRDSAIRYDMRRTPEVVGYRPGGVIR